MKSVNFRKKEQKKVAKLCKKNSKIFWKYINSKWQIRYMLIIRTFGHNRHGPKSGEWAAVRLFLWGQLGSHLKQCRLGEAYLSTKWHLDPSSIPAVWPQQTWAENWGCAPLGAGELDPHLTQCGLGWGLLHAKWHIDPSNHLATIDQRHRQDRQDRQTMVR